MRSSRFESIFARFERLGYNVVPAHPREKHPSGAWKGLSDPTARRVSDDDIRAGAWVLDAFPDSELEPFLFPASHPTRPLAVVDVDDLAWLPAAIAAFGDTPIKVWTRRGVHLYYRSTAADKVTSRSWIFGEKSVDVKSWGAGVMSPGASYLDRSASYRAEPALELWTDELLDSLPLFDLSAYERVWIENRPKARALARSHARPETHPFIVAGEPTKTAQGLEYLGDVRGDVSVLHERSGVLVRLDAVPIGDKVHALGREDAHASGQVWAGRDGRMFYTDHTLGTVWRIVAGPELDWLDAFDREPDPIEKSGLEIDLAERYPDIQITTLPAQGWISDQLEPAEGITIIRAPHGTGKTILASDLIARVESAITVANTAALAEHNAERFGITCYRDELDGSSKISTTVNSLPKLELDRVDVFHVDEADAVHGYLHTGNVHNPVETLRTMLDMLVEARFGLVTSADLSFEDVSFFVDAVRARDPNKPIRIYIRKPTPGRRTIELVPLTVAKARFERAFTELRGGDFPVALGWTARGDVAAAAWGYANRRPEVDLRSFWVSGENSRFEETIERFRGRWTDELGEACSFLDSADVFFFSPALQSGVSLEQRVSTVFLLHTKPDFEVETVGQMLMRFRDVAANVVWGSSSFGRRSIRMDDAYLDGVCVALADATDRQIVKSLPEFVGEFPRMRPTDPEFARSWRITQRKIRKSYADPIGRAREIIEAHGWGLIESTEIEDSDRVDARTFNRTRAVGAEFRDSEVARAIAEAETITTEQAEKIDRAHVHREDDRQKLERHRIAEFYGRDPDLTLIELDAKGKFRRAVRTFSLLWLISTGRRDVVAFADYTRTRGKQASEYRHTLQRADMLSDLLGRVFDRDFGSIDWSGEPEEFEAEDLRDRTMKFIRKNGQVWAELFGRPSQLGVVTDPSKAIAWLGAQIRRTGGKPFVTGASKSRRYAYDWSEVFEFSKAERTRLLESFELDRDRENWASKVKEIVK